MFNGSELKKTIATLSLDKKQNMTLIDSARNCSSYPSKLFVTKNWSSNIRQNSFEKQVQISSKLEEKLKLTKQLSVDSDINLQERPSTSISLPIKGKEYSKNSNQVKNPSCPIISRSAKQIKVKSLSSIWNYQSIHITNYYSYYGYTSLQIIASPLVIKFRNAPLATQELLS